jgi:hypothetical protein
MSPVISVCALATPTPKHKDTAKPQASLKHPVFTINSLRDHFQLVRELIDSRSAGSVRAKYPENGSELSMEAIDRPKLATPELL